MIDDVFYRIVDDEDDDEFDENLYDYVYEEDDDCIDMILDTNYYYYNYCVVDDVELKSANMNRSLEKMDIADYYYANDNYGYVVDDDDAYKK